MAVGYYKRMNYCALGRTGIKVSKIGFGTGTTHFTGISLHSSMLVQELSVLLLYAYELGVNLWDTAYTYETYPHIRKALDSLERNNIVISSKTDKSGYKDTRAEVENSLRLLQTDYIDIFLLHGVRNAFDFWVRRGALKKAISFAKNLEFVDSFVIGMVKESEIAENANLYCKQ